MSIQPLSAPELGRIPSLDGLRAVAILLVVYLHTLQRFGMTHTVPSFWYAIFCAGYGVNIFFEISGFLITSLLLEEQRKRGTISLRGFYLRRAFRILPPLYVYIGVVIVLGLSGLIALRRLDILSAMFFFHNYMQHSIMWSIEHLWSISVEEQFYLVWPFILYFFLKSRGLAGRMAAAIVPNVILIVSPVLRVVLGTKSNWLLHAIGVKYLDFDFLMFGCLVALLQGTPRFESIYRAVTRIWWIPPAAILGCSFLSARYQNYFELPIGFTLFGFFIAMFLLWTTRNPGSAVGRILNWKPIVKVGVLSYSIYLWQTLFLNHENVEVFGSFTLIRTFPGNWVAFFLMGLFSYYVIEQPSLHLRDRVLKSLHIYKTGQ